jgi:hypothetical protein
MPGWPGVASKEKGGVVIVAANSNTKAKVGSQLLSKLKKLRPEELVAT